MILGTALWTMINMREEILSEIVRLDCEVRQSMKEWAIIHCDIFDRQLIWQKIKKRLFRNNLFETQSLIEYRKDLAELHISLESISTEIQAINEPLLAIQRQYLEGLVSMAMTLSVVVSGLQEINEHLIIEKKNGNKYLSINIIRGSLDVVYFPENLSNTINIMALFLFQIKE